MEADEAADPRIHLLHRNRRVSASEGVYPSIGGDRIGHQLGGSLNGGKLGPLDVVEDAPNVGQPAFAQHHEDRGAPRSARESTPRSAPRSRSAAGTIRKDPRIPNRSPRTPVV